ncbi:MAG: glutaredoxin family protein [Chloroherpetonaceae bacterium]|nr:glutaredoxin family protein [Chthonomonadaceae bacterium]MDW8208900.1 glutaredoxin family protein [Chloroherpetonaceae bacterium]
MSVRITAYTTSWCADCARSKRLMQNQGICFEEIDIERVPGAEAAMRALNGNSGKVPTIVIEHGAERTVLVEPTNRELTEALRSFLPPPS